MVRSKLKFLIAAPGERQSRTGNQVTAARWARILTQFGCGVTIREHGLEGSFDVLVALHARKSAPAVQQFRGSYPDRPILVAMTGTDFPDLKSNHRARTSLELANFVIVLQPAAIAELPLPVRGRARTIVQSAEPTKPVPPLRRQFEVCVAGHLRPVKDPFRTACAARQLPIRSTIRVTHLGGALTPRMKELAEREMERNSRYRWLGNRPRWQTRRLLARSRIMTLTSKSEGGPSVISEAVMSDVPVISTRIPSVVGLLGDNYPGYFSVGQTAELSDLLLRCEEDARFYRGLLRATNLRKPLFEPAREHQAWSNLLREIHQLR